MPVKRLNYFKGQFLKAVDFELEQKYHIDMVRRHNKDLHTWGIAGGLEVEFKAGERKVTVKAGMAVDALGRMIVLDEESDIDFESAEGKTWYVTIAYSETDTDPSDETGVVGNTRATEAPNVRSSETRPVDPSQELVLAVVKLKDDNSIAEVISEERKYAGIVAADMEAKSIAFSAEIAREKWPELKAQITNNDSELRVTSPLTSFSGSLSVDGELKLQKGAAIDAVSGDSALAAASETAVPTEKAVKEYVDNLLVGSVSAFAMETPPDGWLECNGQALSRSDYQRLFDRIGSAFGSGNGATTFNVPDLRGRFVRGWSNDAGYDPDSDQRIASGTGGTSGNRVGSFQDDALQLHSHDFKGQYTDTGGQSVNHSHPVSSRAGGFDVFGSWGMLWGTTRGGAHNTGAYSRDHHHSFIPSGKITDPVSGQSSTESRPKNIYLMYCIKY